MNLKIDDEVEKLWFLLEKIYASFQFSLKAKSF